MNLIQFVFNKKILTFAVLILLIFGIFITLNSQIAMSFIKSTLRILRLLILNKYVIVFIVFFLYLLFLDNHNLISRWKMDSKVIELENEYKYYENEIKENKMKLNELQTNDKYLEKFAREKYLMKKDDEEIFIIK